MNYSTFTQVVRAGTPFDKGQMMNSWLFYDTPYKFVAVADVNRTPYFVYNEEGTIYTQKNKGFIRNGIMGQLNRITWSENLGLPYSYKETNKILSQRNNSMLMSVGALEVSR